MRTTRSLRRPCAAALAVAVLLLLVPPVALTVTNRDPDALFTRYPWSPVASVPPGALTAGSIGLALLLAVGTAAIAAAALPRSRRAALVSAVLAAAVLGIEIGGWSVAAAAQSERTGDAARAVLTGSGPVQADPEAVRAIRLALGLPGSGPAAVRVLDRSAEPAGPWIVQRTEILNEGALDEGADVQVGSIVDPVSGRVLAAWFWGL